MSRLPLRSRLALLCAGAVALAVVLACVVAWIATRQTLRAQIDESLAVGFNTTLVRTTDGSEPLEVEPAELARRMCADPPVPSDEPADELPRVQLLLAGGDMCRPGPGEIILTPTPEERAVATSGEGEVRRDATTSSGEEVRVYTRPLSNGGAVQTVRSLEETNDALTRLAVILAGAGLLGVLLAAAAGRMVARVVLRPVQRLTAAAEHVATTDDLDLPLAPGGGAQGSADEVSRLTAAFNAMIVRLASSRRRQQQLVADASHELRTPVTSLRTHVEWLMRAEERGRPLTDERRRAVEQAVLGQADELAELVADLARVARGEDRETRTTVHLDEVVLRAVERAQRRDPGRRFDLLIEPTRVEGSPAGLERAVLNLLDNALKFSDGPVTVELKDRQITVADRGDGLPTAARASAFERFWRAESSRGLPGSGLGLAIVADTAHAHGGEVFFHDRPGGGSRVGFRLAGSQEDFTNSSANTGSVHNSAS